jgi:broad specificity phosphatase PhoE
VIIHDCKKFVIHSIRGYLPLKIVHFVMNLHTLPRYFYFTRHGQSEYNLLGKIGGDSGLSANGSEYAKRLALFAKDSICTDAVGQPRPSRLWTSTMNRTKDTAAWIEHPTIQATYEDGSKEKHDWIQMRPMARRNLDELYAGTCDGMTYKEIEEVFPEEFKAR